MNQERDDEYREDDEHDELASRSIFAAGWFRAVLVLTVLAIVVVVSLPYLLNWFEPAAPPERTARSTDTPRTEPPSAIVPAPPSAPAPAPTAPPPVVSTPPAPAPSPKVGTAPPAPAPKAAADKVGPRAMTSTAEKAPPPTASKPATDKPGGPGVAKSAEKPVPAPAVRAAPDKTAPANAPAPDSAAAPAKSAPTRLAKVPEAPARPGPATASRTDSAGGNYWVQLGAFKDQKNADSLAKKLRDDGFPVEISPINRAGDGQKAGAQQHELFVTEASVDKVNTALKGRGRAQPAGAGVVVTPALSLEDAVTESKRLADQGLKVVIRPAGAVGKETSPPGTLYVVRAGGFPDRARALTAREELSAKGHGAGFLAQGPAR